MSVPQAAKISLRSRIATSIAVAKSHCGSASPRNSSNRIISALTRLPHESREAKVAEPG
jgi:hypothetical protein